MASLATRLRVVAVPAGGAENPSSFARVHQHVARLRHEGVRLELIPPSEDPWQWFERVLRKASAADLVWLQNVLLPPRLVRILARAAKRLVFDLDEPLGPEPEAGTDIEARDRLERLRATLAVADLVIADRGVLAERSPECRPGRLRIVPTGIPVGQARPPAARGRLVLGWPGVLGLPVEGLAPLASAVSAPDLARAVELRLFVASADPELSAIAARSPNIHVERVTGAGFEPLQRAFDAADVACFPVASGARARLPALAIALPQSRGAAVAVCDRKAAAAVAPHLEVLPVDAPGGWAPWIRAAVQQSAWLRAVGRRAQRSVRVRHPVEGAFVALAVSLLRASARAAPPRAALPLFPQVSRSSA